MPRNVAASRRKPTEIPQQLLVSGGKRVYQSEGLQGLVTKYLWALENLRRTSWPAGRVIK
jgi:hypothetical protein